MGVHDTVVIADECRNRDRLGWREGEIVEYPTVGHGTRLSVITDLTAGGFEPLREEFAGTRIQVVTELQEFVTFDCFREMERLRRLAKPPSSNGYPFAVIITCGQVFLEVCLRIGQAVLRFS